MFLADDLYSAGCGMIRDGFGVLGGASRVPPAIERYCQKPTIFREADRVPRPCKLVSSLANPFRGLGGGVRRPGQKPGGTRKVLT